MSEQIKKSLVDGHLSGLMPGKKKEEPRRTQYDYGDYNYGGYNYGRKPVREVHYPRTYPHSHWDDYNPYSYDPYAEEEQARRDSVTQKREAKQESLPLREVPASTPFPDFVRCVKRATDAVFDMGRLNSERVIVTPKDLEELVHLYHDVMNAAFDSSNLVLKRHGHEILRAALREVLTEHLYYRHGATYLPFNSPQDGD